MTPHVTVVVTNWNGMAHVRACFDALRRQDYPSFSVLVVDNGSTDGSAELIERDYPEVEVLRLGANVGYSAGTNAGIRRVTSRYCALLNNDTEAEPGWLSALVRALEELPEYGAAASRTMQFDQRKRIDNCGVAVTTIGTAFDIGRHEEPEPRYAERKEVFCPCAAAALFRRDVFDDVGLFDERFFVGYEDVDLGFRMRRMGWRTIYVPDAVVYHKIHATLRTMSERTVYLAQRNVEWVWIKNMPTPLLLAYLPLRLVYELAGMVYFARAGASRPFWRAKRDVLRSLPELLRERRAEQARSRVSTATLRERLYRRVIRQRLPKFLGRAEGVSAR